MLVQCFLNEMADERAEKGRLSNAAPIFPGPKTNMARSNFALKWEFGELKSQWQLKQRPCSGLCSTQVFFYFLFSTAATKTGC